MNGGIRIRQNRIKEENNEWISDTSSYEQGWNKKTDNKNEKSSWHHQSRDNRLNFPSMLFLDLEQPGYILDLFNGQSSWILSVQEHLDTNWLDNRTQRLIIEFYLYTPNVDCITMFSIMFKTTTHLLYTPSILVLTVPYNSVFATWLTDLTTLLFVVFYMCLIFWLIIPIIIKFTQQGLTELGQFQTFFDLLIVIMMIIIVLVLDGRRRLMYVATQKYNNVSEIEFVTKMTEICRVHNFVIGLVTVSLVMSILRIIWLVQYFGGNWKFIVDTLHFSSTQVIWVVMCLALLGFGAWVYSAEATTIGSDEFFNASVLGSNVFGGHPFLTAVVSSFIVMAFKSAVVSIATKYYIISNIYSKYRQV
ncbi:uncharacterized protein LOC126897503 [Daktulosphaira vitifoliae]|uniref:uncharacterized protein LOC126897503 n=1 Tax=Daktulosphaira vitifoliae TaxID=58002 RepID=UPI0021AAF2F9|nr:uncharacterized protein LOC126897503 [Daktulosphaira vitifoliae]